MDCRSQSRAYGAGATVYTREYPYEDCGAVKCRNFELCGEILPSEWLDCRDDYLCDCCTKLFQRRGQSGRLSFSTNVCQMCGVTRRCAAHPVCGHSLCTDCFGDHYYGECDYDEPVFPYPEIADEYWADADSEWWDLEYPALRQYHRLHKSWIRRRRQTRMQHGRKRTCPICHDIPGLQPQGRPPPLPRSSSETGTLA